MVHAGQQTTFLDDLAGARVGQRRVRGQQLQRHLTVEPRIPGAIDLTERAATDRLEQAQMSPACRIVADIVACGVRRGRPRAKQQIAMERGDRGQYAEFTEWQAVSITLAGLNRCPVDGRAIKNGGREIGEHPFICAHRSSSSVSLKRSDYATDNCTEGAAQIYAR
jgi:hypothetical protein